MNSSKADCKGFYEVTSENDREEVQSLLGLSEKNCFIPNSVKSKVIPKPEVRVGSQEKS